MSSYPKWVYGPNGESKVINDEAERPDGFRESPADFDQDEQEEKPRRTRKPKE